MATSPNVIIIGGGAAGICMAYRLTRMGFTDFTIYEKMAGIGGTWYANTYPGCGCDVPSQLYSFSFNLNPNWSKPLCEQPEILAYMNKTVDDFGLRGYFQLQVECVRAEWIEVDQEWVITLKNVVTNHVFRRRATVFVSGVGGISFPKWIDIPGKDTFPGPQFHSARWDHTFDYSGKRLAIIGNGCSASQIVPRVVKTAAHVKQFTRSPQWIHERPNKDYTAFQRALYRYVPLYQRIERLMLFRMFDRMSSTYGYGDKAVKSRLEAETSAKKYVYEKAPPKYRKMLIPDFPLGCKRRVFDPDYLQSLWADNLEITMSKIVKIDGSFIETSDGQRTEVDGICYATGFQVTDFLTPIEVIGHQGQDLNEKWKATAGATAYKGVFVNGFPNMAIIFGPNTFLAHNSAIFIIETGVDFTIEKLIKPLIYERARTVEIKAHAEDQWANETQLKLQKMVWSSGCTNWALAEGGRNTASYPGTGQELWFEYLKRDSGNFIMSGGSKFWLLNALKCNLLQNRFRNYIFVFLMLATCTRVTTQYSSFKQGFLITLSNVKNIFS
jgi:cation diffusion facilitator CzcD-associated flavoprotein CzcO